MKQTQCPSCSTLPPTNKRQFDLVYCKSCKLTWTLVSKDIDASELYNDEVYSVTDNRESIFEKIILWEAKKVLTKAEKLRFGSRRLLDFGSGKGHFLLEAKRMGWTGIGIETAIDRSTFSREKYGVDVIESHYKRGPIADRKFSLITLNHVFEHLPQPLTLLKELVESNLDDKGLLMVEVPRIDSLQSKIAGGEWVHLDIPKHLTHWTNDTLVSALGEIGYKPIADRRFSVHIGVLGMLQALLVRTGYRNNIIFELKNRRNASLIARVITILPLALLLELFSVMINRSGIIGIYFQRAEK